MTGCLCLLGQPLLPDAKLSDRVPPAIPLSNALCRIGRETVAIFVLPLSSTSSSRLLLRLCMFARCYWCVLGRCADADVVLLSFMLVLHLSPGLLVGHQPEQDVVSALHRCCSFTVMVLCTCELSHSVVPVADMFHLRVPL